MRIRALLRWIGTLAAVVVFLAGCGGTDRGAGTAPGAGKTTVKLAVLDDAAREAVLWAVQNGEVVSDTIEVEIDMLPYAAVIEPLGSQAYDVVGASPVAVPRPPQRDLELLVYSPRLVNPSGTARSTRAGSDLRDPGDLRGQSIGVFSLGGTFVLETRYVLHQGYGLNTALTGGDVAFQELPPQNVLELLKTGSLAAGVVVQQAGYMVRDAADYRLLVDVTGEFQRLTGQYSMNSILVTYPETAAARGDALRELARVLQASARYAKEHRDEVIAAVAEARGEDPGYLEYFLDEAYDLVFGDPVADYAAAIRVTWEAAHALGDTPSVPEIDDLIFR